MPRNSLITTLGEPFFAALPSTPGVYFMMGANGRLLYIGKAKNLRSRLRSYTRLRREVVGPQSWSGGQAPRLRKQRADTQNQIHNDRLLELIEHVRAIRWEDHRTEAAALLRESELLRGLRPPYNVAGTDEELYLYIGIRAVETGAKSRLAGGADPNHLRHEFRINNWPDFEEDGYEVFGAYRHRGKVKRGYVALLRLLHAYQCANPRFSYPARISREDPPWQYRAKFPAELGPALREFLSGRSLKLLRLIFDGLIRNEHLPPFMRPSIQDDIELVRELYSVGPALTCKLRRRYGLRTRLVQPEQMSEWVRMDAMGSLSDSWRMEL